MEERARRHSRAPLAADYFKEEIKRILTPPIPSPVKPNSDHPPPSPVETPIQAARSDAKLEKLLDRFHSTEHPKYKWAIGKRKATAINQKSALGAIFLLAKIDSCEKLFSIDHWDDFFESDLVKQSLLDETKQVGSNMAYRRTLSLHSFFESTLLSKLLSAQERKYVKLLKNEVLAPVLNILNKERASESGHAKHKRSNEDFSIDIAFRYMEFLNEQAVSYNQKLASIFVALNSYNGCRSSAIVKITTKMWTERQRFENGWCQIYNPNMKNAQNGHPFVSVDPITEEKIEFCQALRPKTEHDYLFCTSKGEIITGSRANYYCNLLWSEFRKLGNQRYPLRYRFNNQRYAIATTARHDPAKGQPPIAVYNGLLVCDFVNVFSVIQILNRFMEKELQTINTLI